MELCGDIAGQSGCDTAEDSHRQTLGRVRSYIELLSFRRHNEIYGKITEGTPLDSELVVTTESLFDLLSELESISEEDGVILAFYQLLPPDEQSLLMEFSRFIEFNNVDISQSYLKKEVEAVIRENFFSRMGNDSALRPVIEAYLKGENYFDTMRTAASALGCDIEKIKLPQEINIFLMAFRTRIERLIGKIGKA